MKVQRQVAIPVVQPKLRRQVEPQIRRDFRLETLRTAFHPPSPLACPTPQLLGKNVRCPPAPSRSQLQGNLIGCTPTRVQSRRPKRAVKVVLIKTQTRHDMQTFFVVEGVLEKGTGHLLCSGEVPGAVRLNVGRLIEIIPIQHQPRCVLVIRAAENAAVQKLASEMAFEALVMTGAVLLILLVVDPRKLGADAAPFSVWKDVTGFGRHLDALHIRQCSPGLSLRRNQPVRNGCPIRLAPEAFNLPAGHLGPHPIQRIFSAQIPVSRVFPFTAGNGMSLYGRIEEAV